ncbi:hypothetical protein A8C56_17985 [Niabella ginsenosidivorans]|uniref:Uncharacterized protein n=2 Tax=Niabella ginsenosidivorans TaxID=1176587 RepID=A0A1A9I4Y1_9BACT|nr:hypothetical protein A8C56_17985 [Niabella ginsenosidivorans]
MPFIMKQKQMLLVAGKYSIFTRLAGKGSLLSLFLLIVTTLSLRTGYAQQTALSCSMTPVPMVNGGGTFTASFTANGTNTGLSSWLSGLTNTVPRVIDNDLANAAVGTIVVGGSLTLNVTDNANTYSAGNYAGFLIGSGLLNLSALGSITVTTLNDGVVQETMPGSSLLAASSSLISGAYEVGFYTNKPYDQLRLTISSTLGAGVYNVYYAFMRGTGSCSAGPVPDCNTNTLLSFSTHPVVAQSGITGAVAVTAVSNLSNIVDASTSTAASISTVASVAGTAFVSVKNTVADYPAGYFVGFDIQNSSLISLSALSAFTLVTYLDGVQQQTFSGSSLLVGAALLSSSGRQTVGAVTSEPFDEARLIVNNQALVGVDLGVTQVFDVIINSLCPGTIAPNQSYRIAQPEFPAVINSTRTGFDGAVGGNGTIETPENLIDNNPDNYATISVLAGAASKGSISILDAKDVFPAGTGVGFNLSSLSGLLEADLFNSITIETWLDGTLQESQSSNSLLNLTVLGPIFGSGSGDFNAGFVASQPFDEVRISVGSLASVANTVRIYGAFASTDISLPVSFGPVSAFIKDGNLTVNWETLTENNCKEYQVEASVDGKVWKAIYTTPSKAENGNATSPIQYSFTQSFSGLALASIGLMALLAIPLIRIRFLKGMLMLVFLVAVGVSCNKNRDEVNTGGDSSLYIRIAQYDKDGQVHYSKVVKAVKQP